MAGLLAGLATAGVGSLVSKGISAMSSSSDLSSGLETGSSGGGSTATAGGDLLPVPRQAMIDGLAMKLAGTTLDGSEVITRFNGNRQVMNNAAWTEHLGWDLTTPEGLRKALVDVLAMDFATATADPATVTSAFNGNRVVMNNPDWTAQLGW